MDEDILETAETAETVTGITGKIEEAEKNPTTHGTYAIDAKTRTAIVDYPEQKFKLEHDFVNAESRELVKFYLDSPAVKRISKGEQTFIGTPDLPAAELHDATCNGLRRTGRMDKTYTLEEIRDLRASVKSDGMSAYIGGYYTVEIDSESGDVDDLLFERDTVLKAVVKTRPDGSKVKETFTILLNRLDDITLNRFTTLSSSTATVDEKRDETLIEFIGDDNLSEMTGGEDEGQRVVFTKTTQFVRQFLDIFDKSFESFEGATYEGQPYNPKDRNKVLAAMDPVLKIAVAAAIRNFI